MPDWNNLLDQMRAVTYLGVPITQWAAILAAGIVFGQAASLMLHTIASRLDRVAEASAATWDDLVLRAMNRTSSLFLTLVALHVAANFFGATEAALTLMYKAVVLATALQAAAWGDELVTFGLRIYLARRAGPDAEEDQGIAVAAHSAIRVAAKGLMWAFLLLLVLDNLGVNITTLVTGLGIGGIAIALAVQNLLGDVFASLSIVLDTPFEVGDFVEVGDDAGTVENIGVKTTRLRALSGEQLVFPNTVLVESKLRNFKRMTSRRVVFGFGVLYETPPAQLAAIPAMVREIFAALEGLRLDRVHFFKFGDSSLDFEVAYFVDAPEYGAYMDAQETLNFALFTRFTDENIGFAYPTRTLILRQEASSPAPDLGGGPAPSVAAPTSPSPSPAAR